MTIADDIHRLKRIPLLAVLDDIALHHVAFNCEHLEAHDGMTLFFEGEPSTGAIFLNSGKISLQIILKGELEERQILEVGSIIDPFSLVSESRRPMTAKAVGDVSYTLLSREVFRRVLETYPGMAEKLQHYLEDEITRNVSALNGVAARLDFIQG